MPDVMACDSELRPFEHPIHHTLMKLDSPGIKNYRALRAVEIPFSRFGCRTGAKKPEFEFILGSIFETA